MGEPTNMPGSEKLIEAVVGRRLSAYEKQHLDQLLARTAALGVPVHEGSLKYWDRKICVQTNCTQPYWAGLAQYCDTWSN